MGRRRSGRLELAPCGGREDNATCARHHKQNLWPPWRRIESKKSMKFMRQNEPAERHVVAEFEQQRGIRLPEDYVEFLVNINGGYTGGVGSYTRTEGGQGIVVQQFLGLTGSSEDSIATDQFSNFSNWIHIRLLEIAYTPGGEPLFMDLRETGAHGKIYILSYDSPPNDPILIDDTGFQDEDDYEEAQFLHPIANSFSEFTAMLGPAPE